MLPEEKRRGVVPSTTFLLLWALFALSGAQEPSEKTKRQIFREQVLPHTGGKIPEEAFRVDRLALNRLNKDGISVPDGVVLDARRRDKHPALRHNTDLEQSVVKVLVTPENRFVPPEGQAFPQRPVTVDSTYIIRPPIGSYKKLPQSVGQPLPGPPLQFPTKLAGVGPHRQQHPMGGPSHAVLHRVPGFRPARPPTPPLQHVPYSYQNPGMPQHKANDFLLPSSNSILPEHLNAFYSSSSLSDFESLLAQINARAEREAKRIASLPPEPWGGGSSFVGQGPVNSVEADCEVGDRGGPHVLPAPGSRCQMFHVCQRDGRRDTFFCPQGTLFNNVANHCDWWYNVKCT